MVVFYLIEMNGSSNRKKKKKKRPDGGGGEMIREEPTAGSASTSSECTHWVVVWKNFVVLALPEIDEFLVGVFGTCDNLKNVLVEPAVTHHEVALMWAVFTPGVLNSPPDRLSINKMDTCQDHGMGHLGGAGEQPLLLGQVHVCSKTKLVVPRLGVQKTDRCIFKFSNV